MNELSLFTGAGGGLLGSILLGWKTIGAVEIEEYPCKVLEQRQRDGILNAFPIWQMDIREFNRRIAPLYKGVADVITGGFPCQDISIAWTGNGSGKGLDGVRSGLWKEMAHTISTVQPRYAFIENSPMLTIRGLDKVLCDFAKMGMDAKWGIISGATTGTCHVRERIWILAYAMQKGLQGTKQLSKNNPENRRWKTWLYESNRELPHGLSWWKSPYQTPESQFLRRNDVMANRMDRIKAIGEGQVPRVVEVAWEMLSK